MSSSNSGVQLARLWLILNDIQGKIDNEALPLSVHLGLEDPELVQALETLSEQISRHFEQWRLVAVPHGMLAKNVGMQAEEV